MLKINLNAQYLNSPEPVELVGMLKSQPKCIPILLKSSVGVGGNAKITTQMHDILTA
jgi:hypothetical protein